MILLIIEDVVANRERLLETIGEHDVVAELSCATRARGMQKKITELKPSIIVISMLWIPRAFEIVRGIKAQPCAPVVMVLSSSSSILHRRIFIVAGAEYFFNFDRDQELFRQAIVESQAERAG